MRGKVYALGTWLRLGLGARRARRDLLLSHRAVLRPGLWSISHPRISRHIRRGRLPRHLYQTKYLEGRRGRQDVQRIRGLLGWSLRISFDLVWIRGKGRSTPYGTDGLVDHLGSVVVQVTDAKALVIDTDNETVLRILNEGRGDEYLEQRKKLSSYLPTPSFRMLWGGGAILEELISGQPLSVLGCIDRRRVFEELLDRYAALVRGEAGGDSVSLVSSSVSILNFSQQLDHEAVDLVQNSATVLRSASVNWRLVPAHGDMSAENLVVDGTNLHLVDVQCPRELPFFHDLLFLILSEASKGRTDLLDMYCAGQVDERLSVLWESGGIGLEPGERALYLVATWLNNAGLYSGQRRIASLNTYWPPVKYALRDLRWSYR